MPRCGRAERHSSCDDRSHGPRGNAAPGAPRHSGKVTRSVTGCISTQSAGTIKGLSLPHASFAPTGTTTLGFLNTSTLPAITNTTPINAGAVHW